MRTRTEIVPGTWDDARDVPFFRITERLFSARFCWGASVLLAGNDDEQMAGAGSATGRAPGATSAAHP